MKALKIDTNKGGHKHALVEHKPGQFSVWVLRTNHSLGQFRSTWRCCNGKGGIDINRGEFFTREQAEAFFAKKMTLKS